MINFIRPKVPSYKGPQQPTTSGGGMLSGLWCYLFGGGAVPAYRTPNVGGGVNNGGATAPAVSRCWWSFTGTPQYQTPPEPSAPDLTPCDGDPSGDEPAIGREIHIYPSE